MKIAKLKPRENWYNKVKLILKQDNLVLSIEELWVVCGLYTEGGATLLAGAW